MKTVDGFNGFYYSEDLENIADYPSKEPFKKDRYYYHVSLFNIGEKPELEHATDKAFLIRLNDQSFWVPKSMLRIDRWFKINDLTSWKVHKSFKRTYI